METGKIEEKCLGTDEFVEDLRNSRTTREKFTVRRPKMKTKDKNSEY